MWTDIKKIDDVKKYIVKEDVAKKRVDYKLDLEEFTSKYGNVESPEDFAIIGKSIFEKPVKSMAVEVLGNACNFRIGG